MKKKPQKNKTKHYRQMCMLFMQMNQVNLHSSPSLKILLLDLLMCEKLIPQACQVA